jgi:hypothetical protein
MANLFTRVRDLWRDESSSRVLSAQLYNQAKRYYRPGDVVEGLALLDNKMMKDEGHELLQVTAELRADVWT